MPSSVSRKNCSVNSPGRIRRILQVCQRLTFPCCRVFSMRSVHTALSVIPLSLQGESEQALEQGAEFLQGLLRWQRA